VRTPPSFDGGLFSETPVVYRPVNETDYGENYTSRLFGPMINRPNLIGLTAQTV
jgi:hypothetical protein